jgi:hypothetical protein
VLCTEFRAQEGAPEPFEVARIEYRGDVLKLALELPGSAPAESMLIRWELNGEGDEGLGEAAHGP